MLPGLRLVSELYVDVGDVITYSNRLLSKMLLFDANKHGSSAAVMRLI